jgi:hypothetical protein
MNTATVLNEVLTHANIAVPTIVRLALPFVREAVGHTIHKLTHHAVGQHAGPQVPFRSQGPGQARLATGRADYRRNDDLRRNDRGSRRWRGARWRVGSAIQPAESRAGY